MKALLIVDVQNDFLPGGALGIRGSDQILPVINSLIDQFSFVVATKDWHPPEHVSFANTHGKRYGETTLVGEINQELWPQHCVQKTPGSDFSPLLKTKRIRKVFFKGAAKEIDSYSAFYDNGHIHSTGLGEYLINAGVDHIYIVGLATDFCVKYSVLDARKLGFEVTVILDGCFGIELNPGDIDRAIKEMKKAGAEITQSSVFQTSGRKLTEKLQ